MSQSTIPYIRFSMVAQNYSLILESSLIRPKVEMSKTLPPVNLTKLNWCITKMSTVSISFQWYQIMFTENKSCKSLGNSIPKLLLWLPEIVIPLCAISLLLWGPVNCITKFLPLITQQQQKKNLFDKIFDFITMNSSSAMLMMISQLLIVFLLPLKINLSFISIRVNNDLCA